MKSIKIILLIAAGISYIIVMGGATYEHLVVVPKWSAAPPESLSMFQGKYGLDAGRFWIPVHPVTIVLLVGALIANWKTSARKWIAWSLALYLIILIVTTFSLCRN